MHLSTEKALDLLEDRMVKDEQTFWSRHMDACKDCTLEVGRLSQISKDLKRSHLMSAPSEDLNRAFQILPKKSEEKESTLRQVLAAIVFDSFLQPNFAGARRAALAQESRQLVLRAEDFDIHIKIWGEPEHRQMLGQLLPRSGDDFVQIARFHLLRNGERLETTAVDELGEFHFADVPEGDLSLQIDLPNLTVIGALK